MNGKIGYLGPYGSYSRLAAEKLGGGKIAQPYGSFYLLMRALLDGAVDHIVLPIANTLNGGVTQNIDLLQSTEGVIAVAECFIRIDHRLVTLPEADLGEITAVYSHPQALGQCAKFLAENLPQAKQIETPSTAGSIHMVKTVRDAAIVGSHCAAEGLRVSAESISDEKKNYTQFLLVQRGKMPEDKSSEKIYFSVTCRHEPGALVDLLGILREYRLNMTKIESRPIKEKVGEYRFFIEMEADYAAPKVKSALADVTARSNSFKLIGCY